MPRTTLLKLFDKAFFLHHPQAQLNTLIYSLWTREVGVGGEEDSEKNALKSCELHIGVVGLQEELTSRSLLYRPRGPGPA